MDIYVSTYDGADIDLDDMSNYSDKRKEMSMFQLWNEAWAISGRAIFYIKYIHSDTDYGDQWFRVDTLCKELMELWELDRENSLDNRLKMLKWIYRFEDEVENLC